MRVALRRHFKDPRQLLPILEILDMWLDKWGDRGPFLGFSLEMDAAEVTGDRSTQGVSKTIKNIEKRTGMPAPECVSFVAIV